MQENHGNIYKIARTVSGLTQERWAEAIDVSVESVRGYENGTNFPGDEIVRRMCEISGIPALAYWHLNRKSPLAAEVLPTVERVPLPQAVVQLLCAIKQFGDYHSDLLEIASDGKVTTIEAAAWENIVTRLDAVVKAAIQVKVAEGGA